ncbi:MAG: nucleotidyl transferase AbiEii/AbiGii toxin family protein [Acidimicrobiales bacterium]
MLTRLQYQVALIVAGVIDAQDIGLAGGGALISQGLVDRLTRDLDFFATPGVVLAHFAPRVIEALIDEGLEVEVKRKSETFYRLAIKSLDGETELDLAIDARLFPLIESDIGKALSPLELAIDKVLAIFGRAEPRDFLDLATLLESYDLRELFKLARQKDPGFTPEIFAAMSNRIDVLPSQEFGLDNDSYATLLSRVATWQEQARRPVKTEEIVRERGHDHGLGL